ncbi:MAG TPA: hypothetical protein VFG71_10640 [Nitrospiraceae bacterium]|nr:hypothetical protein [Nitrospiraceae bacterium]
MRLIVEDDGVGFDPDGVNGGGAGLKNMAARAGSSTHIWKSNPG